MLLRVIRSHVPSGDKRRGIEKLEEEHAKISSEISKMEGKIDPIKAMVEAMKEEDVEH